jgi:hypothetical protein
MGLPHRLHQATPAELERRIDAERAGRPFLFFRDAGGAQHIVVLGEHGARLAVGRHPTLDVALHWDDEVSRLHAELECLGDEWTVADVGSRNGSFVNDERLDGRRRLRDGDVLRIGRTALAFFAPGDRVSDVTVPTREPLAPLQLSAGQRRVLVALCRPCADGGSGVPASNRRIADELFLSVETVKSHLRALFEAFGLESLPQNEKRATLARLALTRGVVTRQELAAPPLR